ncbi:hypothetical protein CASFOL_009223 [Castilleja foliolosa]|uniref:Uncharacterized protein n=1 Tax=Castilleja foliolosa TaxID=1961234 RepID=A0ABD3DXP2_9LAMI
MAAANVPITMKEALTSSRSRRSRRLPNRINFAPTGTLPTSTYFDEGDYDGDAIDRDAANPTINEVKNFVDGRYICPHEASWRILNFPIHERTPAVEVLAVHLEDMQNVTFKETTNPKKVPQLIKIVRGPTQKCMHHSSFGTRNEPCK